jgi:beta-glucanase (GH16 family)
VTGASLRQRSVGSAIALLLVACGGGEPAAVVTNPSNSDTSTPAIDTSAMVPGWTLVWHDEFEQEGLPDSTRWDFDTHRNQAGWYNNELQYYSKNRLENAQVKGGKLIITARKERLTSATDFGGQNYTSARLITQGKASWTYGRFEIRAKLPCAVGTWPAIWTLGTGGAWPGDGEIDIMEQKGFNASEKQKVLATVHTTSGSAGAGPSKTQSLPNACTAFNTYHMNWYPDRIEIGVNGSDYYTYNNLRTGKNQWPFDQPQYLLLNVAVGGTLGGTVVDSQLPATMEVEWVRVYRKD